MSKRNNHFKRVESTFETNKNDKVALKSNSFHVKQGKPEMHNGSKQVQSRLQYINLRQQQNLNINKLDLIFQKQPKEIQQKLMKLLISYNAILQYNKNTDLFEVDLMLPFLNQDQKREFISQFLQIRKNKSAPKNEEKYKDLNVPQQNQQNKKEATNNKSNTLNQSKEIRKFSFNNNIRFSSQFEQQIQHRQEEMLDQLNYEEQRIQQEKKKIVFLPEQYNRFRIQHEDQIKTPLNNIQNKPIFDLKKVEQSINQRLKNAISIIQRKKGKQQRSKQNQNNSRSIFFNQEQSKNTESIIQKFAQNNQFNDSQKISEKNSNYIKQDIGQTQQESEQHLFGKINYDQYNFAHSYQSQRHKYRQTIQQQQEEQQYEPLFTSNNQKPVKNDKVTSFQDYTRKYTTLKQDKNKNKANNGKNNGRSKLDNQVNIPKNYFSSKEKDQNKKSQKSFDNLKKTQQKVSYKTPSKHTQQRQRSRKSSSHSRSYKQSPSKQSQQIKQRLNDFFNQHKQNLQNLFSQIRNKIRSQHQNKANNIKSKQVEKQKMPQKSAEELYILVLDDLEQEQSQNTSLTDMPNSRQFKSEIIKEYKKQILVNSKNLSSEDLIRYFKYLHANAKKLYIRYLTNKQK